MKIFLLFVSIAAVAAQKRLPGNDLVATIDNHVVPSSSSDQGRNSGSDRFVDVNGGDRFSDRDRDIGSRGNGNRGSVRFPDFVRVEVEIQRLEDKNGIRKDGKKCDFTKGCDPIVYAYLDVNQPSSPFPGSGSVPLNKWPIIFQADNVNSPTIGKSVNRDVCGGSISKVNLRVHVVDADSLTRNDEMNDFECIFEIDPRDIAIDAGSAQWGPSIECKALFQPDKIRLFARERTYQISSSSCRAENSAGSPTGSRDRFSTDSGNSLGAGGKIRGQHDNIRIDTEVIQLLNPQGITSNKKACDVTNPCDPKISAYLDTDKALAAWPGSKTVPQFPFLFQANNQNSPIINKIVSKNMCGGSVGKVNLRAHVVDADPFGSNTVIGDFECLFDADYRLVARDISSAEWSPAQDCKSLVPSNDIRLQYRFRLYDITPTDCGIKG